MDLLIHLYIRQQVIKSLKIDQIKPKVPLHPVNQLPGVTTFSFEFFIAL